MVLLRLVCASQIVLFSAVAAWCQEVAVTPVSGSGSDPSASRPQVQQIAIAVRPQTWSASLAKWKQHRESQGIKVIELDAELGRDGIQAAVVSQHKVAPEQIRFVVLCGDVGTTPTTIPTFYRPSTALVQFGGDKQLATDVPYADVDGDDLPDLAIGRIPADTANQLADYLDRVIAYERSTDFTAWRRNVHVVAGVGGFGPVADSMIEMTTRKFLGDRIPGWTRVTMTQASAESHYCPSPVHFAENTIDRINEGGLFWVYIGHGHIETLDRMRLEQSYLPIFDVNRLPNVDASGRPPISIFLACYTGATDASRDSLAERFVLKPEGSIAAVAASRISGPYGLAMLSNGMLSGFYEHHIPSLGEIVLFAKRESAKELDSAALSSDLKMIDSIAQAMSPKDYDLLAERIEHVWQVQLIGDPTLQMPYPHILELNAPKRAVPGQELAISGIDVLVGELTLELTYRRTDKRRDLGAIDSHWTTPEGQRQYRDRYLAANHGVISSTTTTVAEDGTFQATLDVPVDLGRGRYSIRAVGAADGQWQAGYTEISVRPPR
ncbi:MAG TPA: hypothetical protein DDW52_14135 [Planctomycetaceae bacterium]|nr:hypothetical protein [Planctomycetaceae bacterium]